MNEERRHDVWAAGSAYEAYVGRWSRLVAQDFLAWLAVPPGRSWLDVGCGTGVLTETILRAASPSRVMGVDSSSSFVAHARNGITDARAGFATGDAQALPATDDAYDVAVSGLVLNFVPVPEKAATEMARVIRPGGVAAAYVWDYAEGMEMMRYFWNAATALFPEAQRFDEGRRFSVCNPKRLGQLLADAGLRDVAVRAIDVPTHFRDFADYWSPFLGGTGSAPGYAKSLSEADLARLRERVQADLPTAGDGSISLNARAWAVRGMGPP